MNRWMRWLVLPAALVVILACGKTAPDQTDPNQQATKIALGVAATQNASLKATLDAQPAAVSTSAPLPPAATAAPTEDAAAAAATETAWQASQQATQEAGQSQAATRQAEAAQAAGQQATQALVAQATAQAQPMYDIVQKLYKNNGLLSTEGVFYPMDDLEQTHYDAKQYYWHAYSKQKDFANFVMRADVTWRVPGNIEKPEWTGCGFMYGYTDPSNYHTSFLGVDGIVHTFRGRTGERIEMKGGKYGDVSTMGGDAELMLIVEEEMMTFYVNGVQVVRFRDPYIATGKIGLAVLTGSPQGFTCKMKNIGIWELE